MSSVCKWVSSLYGCGAANRGMKRNRDGGELDEILAKLTQGKR